MSERYRVRGLELAYHTWGDPSRPPILMIHGFQDHGQSFARTARMLAKDWFIIAPDLRGHGESGWIGDGGDYYFYDYVYDVLTLVELLAFPKLKIVGHSMGGNVASYSCSLLGERVETLLLLEGMGFVAQSFADTQSRLQRWSATLKRPGIDRDRQVRRLERAKLRDIDEAAARLMRYNERLAEDHARELATTFTEPCDDGAGVVWRFDPLHKAPSPRPYLVEENMAVWRTLSLPVISLYGGQSPWLPPDIEARLACLSASRAGIVEGAGHNIHHDRPQVLAAVIDGCFRDSQASFPSGVHVGLPSKDA